MQAHLRFLSAPLQYWRTLLLVCVVGLFLGAVFQDITAVLLASSACAFVFRNHEHRQWIALPDELMAGDIIFRAGLVFIVTYLAQRTST